MAVQLTDMADLVKSVLDDEEMMSWTDLIGDQREYIVLPKLMNKNKMKWASGTQHNYRVVTDSNGSFAFCDTIADTNTNSRVDAIVKATIPIRSFKWSWWIDKHEKTFNSGKMKLLNLLLELRITAAADGVKNLEKAMWRACGATDTVTMWGIPNWIVKSATAATFANNNGFNGGVASGWSDVAGISPTTYTRWQNYTDAYADVSTPDFVRKLGRALEMTKFMPIVKEVPSIATGYEMEMYSNYDQVVGPVAELMRGQNQNIGTDLQNNQNAVSIRGIPFKAIAALDDDTTGPIYGINWSTFFGVGNPEWWMRESVFDGTGGLGGKRNVVETYTDTMYNTRCVDRRKNFVLSNGTTMPA